MVARRGDRLEGPGRRRSRPAAAERVAIEADVADRDQAEARGRGAVEQLGRLDVVVNNAGVMLLGPIHEAPVEEWDRMVEVNLLGLLYVSQGGAAAPARGGGGTSRDGSRTWSTSPRSPAASPGFGSGVYNATKHGVGAFTRVAAPGGHRAPRARSR